MWYQSGHQAPKLYMNDYTFNGASSPQLNDYVWTQQPMQQQPTT